mgnify:CR=1 FL=1
MRKIVALALFAACGSAAVASPEFSPEDRACQLPCENRAATPTPVTPSKPPLLDKQDSAAARQEVQQLAELRRLAWAEKPRAVR